MKKLLIAASILLLYCTIFFSCSKASSSPSNAPVPITGYWFGTYTNGATDGHAGVVFNTGTSTVLYNFGTSALTDTATCPSKFYGTYATKGNTVNFIVNIANDATLNYTAIVAVSTDTTMTGTYTNSKSGSGGSFTIKKVPRP